MALKMVVFATAILLMVSRHQIGRRERSICWLILVMQYSAPLPSVCVSLEPLMSLEWLVPLEWLVQGSVMFWIVYVTATMLVKSLENQDRMILILSYVRSAVFGVLLKSKAPQQLQNLIQRISVVACPAAQLQEGYACLLRPVQCGSSFLNSAAR